MGTIFMPRKCIDRQNNAKKSSTQAQIKKRISEMISGMRCVLSCRLTEMPFGMAPQNIILKTDLI
jgi:hypothetical protein